MVSAGLVMIPVLGGFFAAVSALLLVLWLAAREARGALARSRLDPLTEPRTFRFHNGYLVDHSEAVGFLLPDPLDRITAWSDLRETLKIVGVDAGAAFEGLASDGVPFQVEGVIGRDRISVIGHREGSDLCICVAACDQEGAAVRVASNSLAALAQEREALLRSNETSPTLAWTVDSDGQVAWSNGAYRELVSRCLGRDAARGWPLRRLFADGDSTVFGRSRRKCEDSDGAELWYDVTLSPADADGIRHGHAIPLDAVIKAEESLRSFIQTLTKSFAFLPTGLAIFDRNGCLTLFNPALVDMTGLDAAWLTGRPSLRDVFDVLRDAKKIPEPRDYKAWLRAMSTGTSISTDSEHVETWTLHNGISHRLTARPQGDGAITLVLEDVTVALATEQRIRIDRELFGDILDMTEAGVVTFDASGKRTTVNATAQAIWHRGNPSMPLPTTLAACLTLWASLSHPSPLWGEIRDMLQGPLTERGPWDQEIALADGSAVTIRVLPQPDGGLALALRSDRDLVALPPLLASPDVMTA